MRLMLSTYHNTEQNQDLQEKGKHKSQHPSDILLDKMDVIRITIFYVLIWHRIEPENSLFKVNQATILHSNVKHVSPVELVSYNKGQSSLNNQLTSSDLTKHCLIDNKWWHVTIHLSLCVCVHTRAYIYIL